MHTRLMAATLKDAKPPGKDNKEKGIKDDFIWW